MDKWEQIIPGHVKWLKLYAYVILAFSLIELVPIVAFLFLVGWPADFLFTAKFFTLFGDIALSVIILRFARRHYPDLPLSVRQQYWFLISLYLTLFSFVIYLSLLYQVADVVVSLGDLITGIELSEKVFLVVAVVLFISLKTIFLLLLQVKGFRLVKEIRMKSRESSNKSTDLL